jgi:hypothetical protein
MPFKNVHASRLTPKQAAPRIKYSLKTLEAWRRTGKNLPFHKVGGRIYYNISDLEAFNKGKEAR